jgi:protein-S-isoprenylcysteine O-methyltransferase Ste14
MDEGGILGFVRHPWYLAVLILIWARDLAVADFIINGIVIGYIVVGTRLEECKLAMDIGHCSFAPIKIYDVGVYNLL